MAREGLRKRAFLAGYIRAGLKKQADDGAAPRALDTAGVNKDMVNFLVKALIGGGSQLAANKIIPKQLQEQYPWLTGIGPGAAAALLSPDVLKPGTAPAATK